MFLSIFFGSMIRAILASVLIVSIAACTTRPVPVAQQELINDPHEVQNRKVHNFNKKLAGKGKGGGLSDAVPEPIESAVHNVAETLAMPQVAVNSLLQGDLRGTGIATSRLVLNATFGIAGLFDAATAFDIPQHDTDFGETLYVWRVAEGSYVELPFIGPSTQRDAVGRVVDLFTNPLSYALGSPERYAGIVMGLADKTLRNSRRAGAIDEILSGSADSYAQARLIYLQKRRHELARKQGLAEQEYDDPYAL